MFRMRGDGRITRYHLGTGGTYQTSLGYFETLAKNPDGSFDVITKYQTRYHYQSVPNTPFLVHGPVLRLTSIPDRNNYVTTLAYTLGDLTSITDTYSRSFQLTYNSSHHLVKITDPAGQSTTITYNSSGCLITVITDPTGHSRSYTYNALYQVTLMVDREAAGLNSSTRTTCLTPNSMETVAVSTPSPILRIGPLTQRNGPSITCAFTFRRPPRRPTVAAIFGSTPMTVIGIQLPWSLLTAPRRFTLMIRQISSRVPMP